LGAGNLSVMQLLFNTSVSGANACSISYNAASNVLYLANNAGSTWLGGIVAGQAGTQSNSQCTISGSGASATVSGNQLALTVPVTFQASFAGVQNDYLFAYDNETLDTVWQQMGTWTVPVPPSSLTISSAHSGSFIQGQNGVYTLTVSNQSGAAPTTGTVAVTETLPSGMTLVSMTGGSAWNCSSNICATANILQPGTSYPAIAVTAAVSPYALSPETNQVSVTGGGSPPNSGSDPTTIVAPDFTISLMPVSSPATAMLASTVQFTVTVSSVNNFAGAVNLAALGLPTGFTPNFYPTSICLGPQGTYCNGSTPAVSTGTSALSVTAPGSGAGNFAVTANGSNSSGSLAHVSQSVPVSVQDFTGSVSPYNPNPWGFPTISPGGSQTFTINTAGINGYTGNINVGYSQDAAAGGCSLANYSLQSPVAAGSAATLTLWPNGQNTVCYFQRRPRERRPLETSPLFFNRQTDRARGPRYLPPSRRSPRSRTPETSHTRRIAQAGR
jgi:uncharacterized repeat protein (TIGR01451 family)